jgi:hypothetical protein
MGFGSNLANVLVLLEALEELLSEEGQSLEPGAAGVAAERIATPA